MTGSVGHADRYGVVPPGKAKTMSGLQLLTAIMEGQLPAPPIQQALDFRLVHGERGSTAFVGNPKLEYYNPIGSVHVRIYRRPSRFLHGMCRAFHA